MRGVDDIHISWIQIVLARIQIKPCMPTLTNHMTASRGTIYHSAPWLALIQMLHYRRVQTFKRALLPFRESFRIDRSHENFRLPVPYGHPLCGDLAMQSSSRFCSRFCEATGRQDLPVRQSIAAVAVGAENISQ